MASATLDPRWPSQPQSVRAISRGQYYSARWQRHTGVVACPRPLRGGVRPGHEPAASELQVRCPTNTATTPPLRCVHNNRFRPLAIVHNSALQGKPQQTRWRKTIKKTILLMQQIAKMSVCCEVISCFAICVRYNMVYSGLYECNEYNAL